MKMKMMKMRDDEEDDEDDDDVEVEVGAEFAEFDVDVIENKSRKACNLKNFM
jgi:hypothetical protein